MRTSKIEEVYANTIFTLIGSNPFYSNLLMLMSVNFTNKIPIAAIGITDTICLMINPEPFIEFNPQQRREILIHECMHFINAHHLRFRELGEENHKLFNMACDYEINEPLQSLRQIGLFVDDLKSAIPDIKNNATAEYYYEKLKEYNKDNDMGDMNTHDSHEYWGDPNQDNENADNKEIQKQQIRSMINNACKNISPGRIPMEVQIALDKLNKPTINWKQKLRKFFSNSISINKEPTRKRINRRYGLACPGKKKKPYVNMVIGIDESGSVGNDEFSQFFAEIDKILDTYNNQLNITIIQGDTKVNSVYEYNKGTKIKRSGCGGTVYAPIFDKANELKPDGMVFFGDGEIWGEEDSIKKPKYPVLWAMTRGNPKPLKWGAHCDVKIKNK